MPTIKFIRPKASNLFIGSVMLSINDKHIPLQIVKIKSGIVKTYELVDINTGQILITKVSGLLILSIEDNGKYYPVKYCCLGKALKLIDEGVTNIKYKTIKIDNKHIAALI